MAYNPTMLPGWEGGEKFSLRVADQFNQNFNSSYNNALNRKQQQQQFDERKASAVEAEAKRIVKVMGLAKQLEQISTVAPTQKTYPGPSGEGMGSDAGDTAEWETKPATAQETVRKGMAFINQNPHVMVDRDTAPIMRGWMETQGKLAKWEMDTAKGLKALERSVEQEKLAEMQMRVAESAAKDFTRRVGVISKEFPDLISEGLAAQVGKVPSDEIKASLALAEQAAQVRRSNLKAQSDIDRARAVEEAEASGMKPSGATIVDKNTGVTSRYTAPKTEKPVQSNEVKYETPFPDMPWIKTAVTGKGTMHVIRGEAPMSAAQKARTFQALSKAYEKQAEVASKATSKKAKETTAKQSEAIQNEIDVLEESIAVTNSVPSTIGRFQIKVK